MTQSFEHPCDFIGGELPMMPLERHLRDVLRLDVREYRSTRGEPTPRVEITEIGRVQHESAAGLEDAIDRFKDGARRVRNVFDHAQAQDGIEAVRRQLFK